MLLIFYVVIIKYARNDQSGNLCIYVDKVTLFDNISV